MFGHSFIAHYLVLDVSLTNLKSNKYNFFLGYNIKFVVSFIFFFSLEHNSLLHRVNISLFFFSGKQS